MVDLTLRVDAWSATIRTSLTDGPSLQFFESEIQSHGFAFLDGYLDKILSKSAQE
jgi:hypothetical protein